jgi:DNA-binding beta-propeller fold protein YncE
MCEFRPGFPECDAFRGGRFMMNRRAFMALSGMGLLTACGAQSGGIAGDVQIWGKQGRRFGEFLRPRAVAVKAGEVYVIDTTGRLQVFGEDGVFRRSWDIPKPDNGTPTAITFHENGRVLVPDTHNSRVLEYTPEGELLDQWGSYGNGPDQFIYPTGLAMGPGGEYFLSEYGDGAERVHVFDANRKFLRQWGSHGEAQGQFNRAMAIGINSANEIVVADTANHRVACFTPEGQWIRSIGAPGTEPGQLKFPHDLCVGPDDCVYVAEYGTHRISRFAADGRFIQAYGSAGRQLGQFNAPRGVAVSENNRIYVADTDNHRIQAFDAGSAA